MKLREIAKTHFDDEKVAAEVDAFLEENLPDYPEYVG